MFLILVERGLGNGGFESLVQRPLAEDFFPFYVGLDDSVLCAHQKIFGFKKTINLRKLASVEFAQKANHGQPH